MIIFCVKVLPCNNLLLTCCSLESNRHYHVNGHLLYTVIKSMWNGLYLLALIHFFGLTSGEKIQGETYKRFFLDPDNLSIISSSWKTVASITDCGLLCSLKAQDCQGFYFEEDTKKCNILKQPSSGGCKIVTTESPSSVNAYVKNALYLR